MNDREKAFLFVKGTISDLYLSGKIPCRKANKTFKAIEKVEKALYALELLDNLKFMLEHAEKKSFSLFTIRSYIEKIEEYIRSSIEQPRKPLNDAQSADLNKQDEPVDALARGDVVTFREYLETNHDLKNCQNTKLYVNSLGEAFINWVDANPAIRKSLITDDSHGVATYIDSKKSLHTDHIPDAGKKVDEKAIRKSLNYKTKREIVEMYIKLLKSPNKA